jgi:hypothetical protein
MPTVSENVELMQKYFPKCPICGSERGYVPSAFYPNIQCKSCKAEWLLFDDKLELKGTSRGRWDKELLNKKYAFQFWKTLKKPEEKLTEKLYSQVFYIGGHTDYGDRTLGYILLKPDSIAFKTGLGSLHEMNVEIPIEQVKGIEIKTGKEITFTRWFLIGVWSILFKKKREYLVLTYEDSSDILQRLVFDFEQKEKMYDLHRLAVSLRKKKEVPEETENPLKVLQIRFAKGEISKEEYVEMKKTLES